MPVDLSRVYTSTDKDMGAELKCLDHPDWYADIDGTNLPDVITAGTEHARWEHREHVDNCMCDGNRVLDTRCVR